MIALAPSVAAGAVPKAEWYWSLVVSASDPNTLFVSTSSGLYRSTDGGKNWHATGPSGVNATSLAQVGSTLFIGGLRLQPGAKPVIVTKGAYVSAPGAGVFESSTDGGTVWHQLRPRGLPNVEIQALDVYPTSIPVLYAMLRGGQIYRSTDGGDSFQLVSPKVGGPAWALAVTQSTHFIAGNMSTGSYLSTTGRQWLHTSFADPKGGAMVMEYAVQPSDLKRVLMTSYGVLMSTDSGKSWQVALKSKVMFGPVAWAPANSGVAYAVGWDRSVWRSGNDGRSWRRVT